jgi:excisionase family DNA binding protein
MNNISTYLTTQELMTLTRSGRTTIYRRVAEGKLPQPRRNGSKLLWLRSEVEAALENLPVGRGRGH